jgi:hypothetical protein
MTDQTTTPAEYENRLCVPFREALWWIAWRNLAGWNIGPRRICERLVDDSDFEDYSTARLDFAVELLLDYATRGKIRIYACYRFDNKLNREGLDCPIGFGSVKLEHEFLAKATYTEETGESALYWCSNNQEQKYIYADLSVDYVDLTEHFWGDAEGQPARSSDTIEPPSAAAAPPRMLRPMSRRGRPRKYKWADFAAEAIDHCLTAGPLQGQSELVGYMKNWCAENWLTQAEDSDLRAWVAPIFRKFEEHWQKIPTRPAENSERAGTP